jgi:hypothetical protein
MWLNELWQRWMGQAPRPIRRRRHPSRMRTCLTVEALEERTLLSISNPVSASDLIAAINMANSSGTPTTIPLTPATIFNFTSPNNSTDGANALPVITGNITIVGNNDTIVRTGSTAYRFFDVASGGSLTLQNLTLEGGLAQGTGPAADGGAVYSSGTVNLSGVTVQNNKAQGINGTNESNAYPGGSGANALGGGLYVAGPGGVTLTNDTFTSNGAQGGSGGSGGNNTPSGNVVVYGPAGDGGVGGEGEGGAVYVLTGGNVTLTNDTFSGNGAFGGFGGTGGEGGFGGTGGQGGQAAGGAVNVWLGNDVTLINNTFSANEAEGGPGGVGGIGGFGGGGLDGTGGEGGQAAGGGLIVEFATNVALTNGNGGIGGDTFSSNGAFGGSGGFSGNGLSGKGSNGGNGGIGGAGSGGGLEVEFAGSVALSGDTLNNNNANGGLGGNADTYADKGAAGGTGGAGGNSSGGGLYVEASDTIGVPAIVTLVNDTLSANDAVGGAGGIGGAGGTGFTGIFGGANGGAGGPGGAGGAGAGGGLYVQQGTVTLVNDTLSGNAALGGAGGNGQNGAPGSFNPIIGLLSNSGGKGGDGGNGGSGEGGGFDVPAVNVSYGLANTLVAENYAASGLGGIAGLGGPGSPGGHNGANGPAGDSSGFDVSGTVISSDHDLIGDSAGSSGFSTANGDILNPTLIGTVDNGFGPLPIDVVEPLANNGGPTETLALTPGFLIMGGNPAIGNGDPNAPNLPPTDQRGAARIVNGIVDIGAVESEASQPPPGGTPALSISGNGSSFGAPGGVITYTLTVTNNSSTAQSDVDVADPLPADTTLVSWATAAGWGSSAPPAGSSSATVTAWIDSLAANSSATFTLVVQVTAGTPVGTVISDTAFFGPFAEASNSGTNSVGFNTTVLYAPTVKVVDGGTYNGNPFPATATAVGIDGITPVAGSFSYAYFVGTGTAGTSLGSTAPTNAATYTVVATFTSSNPSYSGGSAQTTFTISPAPISYTIGNDTQAHGYPANLAADLPPTFNTGIDGQNLDITYSSSGDTSTAPVGTYAITGVVSNGTGLASNYTVKLTAGTLTVLGSGVTVVGSTLWIVGGLTSNDNVLVNPAGSSWTGSTGITVDATLNNVHTLKTYSQTFTTVYIFLYGGNDNIYLAPTLTITAKISAGNGNDNLLLDDGNNTVTLGDGTDNILAGDGNNTLTAGKGNDNVVLGCGSNVVTLRSGNDNVLAGSGINTVTAGKGNDNVVVGDGSNIVTLGDGNHNVLAGCGNNSVTAGNGNDNVVLGDGANTVMVGNGNDNTLVGNGDNVIVEGNGHDSVIAGNGDNLIVAGLGQHTVLVGDGSNILIDGSVQLTQSGDSLRQVLDDWILYGDEAANVASISSRLQVTSNTLYANTLHAGSGLDWFWATDTHDNLNVKKTDLLN